MTKFSIKRPVQAAAVTLLLAGGALTAQQPNQEEVFQLANLVRKRIVTLNNYGVFDSINFGIQPGAAGYKVVLKGSASRPTLKPAR